MPFQEFAAAVRKACEKAREAGLPFEETDFNSCPLGYLLKQESYSWSEMVAFYNGTKTGKIASAYSMLQTSIWGFIYGYDADCKEKAFQREVEFKRGKIDHAEFSLCFDLGRSIRSQYLEKKE